MPRLQDKLYGEMDWDDEEVCWFSLVEIVPDEKIQVCVYAETPVDFLAVGNTHRTYQRLIGDITKIRHQAMRELIANNKRISRNKRQRQFVANIIEKELRVFLISIFEDLSATVYFDSDIFEEEEFIRVLIGSNGEFLDAGVSDGL